jgi:hypothetical protein
MGATAQPLEATVPMAGAAAVMSEIAYLAVSLGRLMDLVIEADEGWQDFALAAQALGNQIGCIADRATMAYGEMGVRKTEEWLLPPAAVDALASAARGSARLAQVAIVRPGDSAPSQGDEPSAR